MRMGDHTERTCDIQNAAYDGCNSECNTYMDVFATIMTAFVLGTLHFGMHSNNDGSVISNPNCLLVNAHIDVSDEHPTGGRRFMDLNAIIADTARRIPCNNTAKITIIEMPHATKIHKTNQTNLTNANKTEKRAGVPS